MIYYQREYQEFETIKEHLLFKKIVAWTEDSLTLDDGTVVTIEESEQDCCAHAGGEFKDVILDAVITDIKLGEATTTGEDEYDGSENYVTVTIFHNQNPIALAECAANDGNGGYYYSVCSLVVKNVHYKVVEA